MFESQAIILRAAALAAIGEERLAALLKVSLPALQRWIQNDGGAPEHVIRDALQIIEKQSSITGVNQS